MHCLVAEIRLANPALIDQARSTPRHASSERQATGGQFHCASVLSLVAALPRLANHSAAGGTSARPWNSAAVKTRSAGRPRDGIGASALTSETSWVEV
jgi:hypothetical protein